MNKLLIGLLTLSIAGNTYLILKPKDVVVQKSEPETVIVKEEKFIESDKYKDKYLAATLEIRNLKKMLEFKSEYSLNEDISQEMLNKFLETEMLEKISKDSVKGFEAFHSEQIDPIWSRKVESAFFDVVNINADVENYNFSDVECKSTTCRMRITPLSADGTNNLYLAREATAGFRPGMHENLPNFGTKYVLDENTGDVIVYFWQSQ